MMAATPPCYILLGARAEAGEDVLKNPGNEEEEILFKQIKKRMAETPGFFTKQRDAIKGVTEETNHRCEPSLPAAEEGPAALPGDQRQRLRHQVEVSTTSMAARNRWSTASAAPPT